MFSKLYAKLKDFINEYKVDIIVIAIALILSWYSLPCYINAPGGLVNLGKKIDVTDEYKSKGSFNMAYVSEYRANIFMYLFAKINPNWDIYSPEEYVTDGETYADMQYRDKLEMQEAVDNAIIVAFNKAEKTVNVTDTKTYVTYVSKDADTDVKLKDQIVKVNGEDVSTRKQIKSIMQGDAGTKFNLEVINEGTTYERYATLKDFNGISLIGLVLDEKKEYVEDPKVNFKFKSNESGPSGGLMTTLEIYNSIISDDITHGYKIAGTGTIDENGNVGIIGGVKYKLKGAVNKHADIFLVPNDQNYAEALKEKEEHNYKIEIVGISTIDDALNYLNSLSNK